MSAVVTSTLSEDLDMLCDAVIEGTLDVVSIVEVFERVEPSSVPCGA